MRAQDVRRSGGKERTFLFLKSIMLIFARKCLKKGCASAFVIIGLLFSENDPNEFLSRASSDGRILALSAINTKKSDDIDWTMYTNSVYLDWLVRNISPGIPMTYIRAADEISSFISVSSNLPLIEKFQHTLMGRLNDTSPNSRKSASLLLARFNSEHVQNEFLSRIFIEHDLGVLLYLLNSFNSFLLNNRDNLGRLKIQYYLPKPSINKLEELKNLTGLDSRVCELVDLIVSLDRKSRVP